jgi:hypothetical protein
MLETRFSMLKADVSMRVSAIAERFYTCILAAGSPSHLDLKQNVSKTKRFETARKEKRGRTQKGDISNGVRKGTFLTGFDKTKRFA